MGRVAEELIATCWPGGLPSRLLPLVDNALCERLIDRFKLGVVFPFEPGTKRPHRIAVSAEEERERWIETVSAAWTLPLVASFLRDAPPSVRLMVDSDGSEQAEIYLDDLPGDELICETLRVPEGTFTAIARHDTPPEILPQLRDRFTAACAGGELWGVRRIGDAPRSILWVSEARWRGTTEASRAVGARFGDHRGYDAALQTLARCGREGYVDAIELWDDGRCDVTLGIC